MPQRVATLPAYIDSTSSTAFADAAPGQFTDFMVHNRTKYLIN